MYVDKTYSKDNKDTIYSYKCSYCDAILAKRVDGYDGVSVTGFATQGKLNFCPDCGKAIIDIYSKTPSHKLFVSDTSTNIEDCPVGLFLCNGELCMKTEYHDKIGDVYRPMAYIVSTGERFCRYDTEVLPVTVVEVDV